MLNIKADLIDKVSRSCGYHKYEVQDVLTALLDVMKSELIAGNEVQFLGVGKLFIKPAEYRKISGAKATTVPVQVGPSLKFKASTSERQR